MSTKKLTLEEFISRAKQIHGDKCDYSKVEYINIVTKVDIYCNTHKEYFKQSPRAHIGEKQGCPKCGRLLLAFKQSGTTLEFIYKSKKIHGDVYDYSKVEYVNNKTKVCIICHKHKEFWQTPDKHLQCHGCPQCSSSKGEKKITNYLTINNIQFNSQKIFVGCRNIYPLKFDFYLSDYNLCIEYDGELHYIQSRYSGSEDKLKLTQYCDNIKTQYCLDNNIKLLRIPYWDFNNIESILNDNIINSF